MHDPVTDAQSLITQNRLLSEEVKRRVDQLAAINTVAASVSQSLDLDRTLETALQAVLDIVVADAGGISLIDDHAREVVLRAQQGWSQDFVTRPMRIPFGKGMSGQVIARDEVVINNDLDGSEELAVPAFHDEHFRSIVMAPMHARGKIIGILSIMSTKPNSFDEDVIHVLRAIADTVGVALDNARLYETAVENENRISAILHSTADGILATDQNGRIRMMNHAAESLLNLKGSALIGVPVREAPIPDRVRDSLLFALSPSAEHHKAFQVTLEDDRVLSVLISQVYVERQLEQDDAMDGWVILLQDVTHLKQSEIARTRFIQAAAHDMRNPLGVAMNSLGMLQNMSQGDAEAQEIIDIAMTGVNRIQMLIDDLLSLEHIESGYDLRLSDVDLRELIYEIGGQIEPLLESKAIRFQVDLQERIPLLKIDRRWVQRAVMNYLDNAIKYHQPGGQVTLRAFVEGQMLHIEAVDNGPGIPIDAQSRLFERFYRVKATDDLPGTGLGLAIVKSVAEAHGGGVYVYSCPGEGSTFGMTLMLT